MYQKATSGLCPQTKPNCVALVLREKSGSILDYLRSVRSRAMKEVFSNLPLMLSGVTQVGMDVLPSLYVEVDICTVAPDLTQLP